MDSSRSRCSRVPVASSSTSSTYIWVMHSWGCTMLCSNLPTAADNLAISKGAALNPNNCHPHQCLPWPNSRSRADTVPQLVLVDGKVAKCVLEVNQENLCLYWTAFSPLLCIFFCPVFQGTHLPQRSQHVRDPRKYQPLIYLGTVISPAPTEVNDNPSLYRKVWSLLYDQCQLRHRPTLPMRSSTSFHDIFLT